MSNRRDRMLGERDPAGLTGLEIGAEAAPLVSKRTGPVRYVDYASTEEVRRNLVSKTLVPEDLVEVDIAWGEHRLKDLVGASVDYVIASHTLEHIPDLAGAFIQVREVLTAGGVFGIAIPDRRFTFNILRPVSTVGEMVEAHLAGYRRPSVRQVYDSVAGSRPCDMHDAWQRDITKELQPLPAKRALAIERARKAQAGEYVDSNCWVFTPKSFLDLLDAMHELGWLGLAVEHFRPTPLMDFEFFVRLTPEDDAGAIADSLKAARAELARVAAAPEDLPPIR